MTALETQVLAAIRAGHTTREALMAIDGIRLMTWARVSEALAELVKRRALVQTKAGWRLVDGRK